LETLFDPNLGQNIHLDLCGRKLDSLKLSIVQLDNGLVLRLETHNAHPMHWHELFDDSLDSRNNAGDPSDRVLRVLGRLSKRIHNIAKDRAEGFVEEEREAEKTTSLPLQPTFQNVWNTASPEMRAWKVSILDSHASKIVSNIEKKDSCDPKCRALPFQYY